jgi:hypothetical protein
MAVSFRARHSCREAAGWCARTTQCVCRGSTLPEQRWRPAGHPRVHHTVTPSRRPSPASHTCVSDANAHECLGGVPSSNWSQTALT